MLGLVFIACALHSGDSAAPSPQEILTAPTDECDAFCISVPGPPGTEVALLVLDTPLVSGIIGEDGWAELCTAPGALAPGTVVDVEQDGELHTSVTADIRPFGYAVGRTRAIGAPETIQWDMRWQLQPEPIFASHPDTWYQRAITSPHLRGDTLYFSGKIDANAPYQLGAVAFSADGVTAVSEEPLFEGSWDRAGQVSPTIIDRSPPMMLYHGLTAVGQVPSLGTATLEDGQWTPGDSWAHGDPDGDKVSHPTAYYDSGADLIEVWHINQDGYFQLSISADGGQTFTPHCNPLPMRGKSPEVAWVEDRYVMTWATVLGDEPVIYWAESFDGIRWQVRGEPILSASDSTWTQDGISNAQLIWIEDAPRLLLLGVTDGEHRVGLATPVTEEK